MTHGIGDGTVLITLVPGIPRIGPERLDDGRWVYPDTTTDFVKLLAARGAEVEYSIPRNERVEMGHKAHEWWLPIVQVALDLDVAILGGLIANAIRDWHRDDAQDSIFHLRIERGKGHNREVIELDGRGTDVLKALEALDERDE